MAKRKRLEIPNLVAETSTEVGSVRKTAGRMPIADVAQGTAARAALDEVAEAMTLATAEGRLVHKLPLDRIEIDHLSRDRMVLDPHEQEVLSASLASRGQQTPIEVVGLAGERYGLISGWRRVHALRNLGATEILAFVRKPETAAASYVMMVEENEIRAGLSFYERANIAVQAVVAGVYGDVQSAVKGLFPHAAPAKRSKILRFVTLHESLGRRLAFPSAIPEKLGLALATAIEADKAVATRIDDALRKTPPVDAAAERRVLERALKEPRKPSGPPDESVGSIRMNVAKGRVVLTGADVDGEFVRGLKRWIAAR